MLRNIEETAQASRLRFSTTGEVWAADEEWPHIAQFRYEVATFDDDLEDLMVVGAADGYRIAQDWTVTDDQQLWDEADALDSDVVRYVEALIRELRACDVVFESAPTLTTAQRVTIVRHIEATDAMALPEFPKAVAASLALMDAPVLMLIDPWPASDERATAKGKLEGRGNASGLLDLGFKRMVGSRFLWAWNAELGDTLMAPYFYEQLLAAKQSGALDPILKARLSDASYGELPEDVARAVDVPDPDELMEE